jgi:RHS repeat-associated protein
MGELARKVRAVSVLRGLRLALIAGLASAWPLAAAEVSCNGNLLRFEETGNDTVSLGVCSSFAVCEQPVGGAPVYAFTASGCDPRIGTCGMAATVAAQFPGNHQNDPGASGNAYSYARVDLRSSTGMLVGYCGTSGAVINQDLGTATVSVPVTCASPEASRYTLELTSCPACAICPPNFPPPQCIKTRSIQLDFAAAAGCLTPPPDSCNEPAGSTSGAAGASCPFCRRTGGDAGCGVSLEGRLACSIFGSGPGAFLRYTAGGPGTPGLPGSSGADPWQVALGSSWSHDHAERVVIDNPDEGVAHVWLITRYASFREFRNPVTGSGLRLYQSSAPSDEYRRLFYDTASGGWQLKGLDGSVEHFRPDGRWLKTVPPSDVAHPTQGTYNGSGQLIRVDFPDGRSETYTYQAGGKLATITENAVGGAPARAWIYTWTGDHLMGIQRPDGTAWELTYGTNGAPADGLSQVRLLGTDGTSGRIMAAFAYDAAGRVKDSWRGDPSLTGPNAADKQSFAYTGASLIAQTTVSRAVSAGFTEITTFNLGRDTVSTKGKVLSMTGSCPTCGLAPNTTFEYGAAQPLLPTAMIDGRQIRTESTYDANGRVLTRRENVVSSTAQRTTAYVYDTAFPGLVKEIDQPSTTPGQTRKTLMAYDPATSVMTSRTIQGLEAGAAFSYATGTTYNAVGQPLAIDPPGYGPQDVTTFTYDVPGTNGYLPDTRTDPLIGATTFGYDTLNRRTSVTDVNNVQAITAYDALDRVTSVTRKGDPSAGVADLVTTYVYDVFRELRCIQLPAGNGIAYTYDAAGRLTEIDRKTDCNPASQILERTVYTLDIAGNRILEERKRYDAGTEVSDGKTEYLHTCHLDKMIQGKGSPAESVTEYCYDEDENLKQIWDANHPRGNPESPGPSTQTYTYDNLNRLTQVSQPWTTGSADTRYGYDIQDHLSQVTDAEGNVTTYTFSDRDLMTRQTSPVSGTSISTYNEHGELAMETDARNIVSIRTADALDRVTALTYPNAALSTLYTYDLGAFGKGRLRNITRNGETVSYSHDRFGRLLQDGSLTYGYDKNGNRTSITYPGAVTATFTHDFTVQVGANPPLPVVTAARYKSSGPLASLTLGNGLAETHSFNARYAPSEIRVAGAGTILHWAYAIDPVGNVTGIADLLNAANDRTYGYQDPQYFLTSGDGPWGERSWTYDKIGNRLTEIRDKAADIYTYVLNGTGGHTPKIATISHGNGPALVYGYDASGNIESDGTQPFAYADDRRMSQAGPGGAGSATTLAYDGRGYLSRSVFQLPGALHTDDTLPTYSSEGLLYHRFAHQSLNPFVSLDAVKDSDLYVFYFAGRPVATLNRVAQGRRGALSTSSTWQYLTADHLGTPILASDTAGALVWQGGFEPFGGDYSAAPTPLRLPGQWTDATWNGNKEPRLYHNVNRWYAHQNGDYTTADPIRVTQGATPVHLSLIPGLAYVYAAANPLRYVDPLGLTVAEALCATRYTLLGIGAGGLAGAGLGCAAGGGVGALAGGVGAIPGCGAGALLGGYGGALSGALGGAIYGSVHCNCSAEREKCKDECVRTWEEEYDDCSYSLSGNPYAQQLCYVAAAARLATCLAGCG